MPHATNAARLASRRAFSLLEITLVLVIIGILMGVAAVSLVGRSKDASIRATRASMSVYKTAISTYIASNANTPPPTLQALVAAGYVEANNSGRPPQDAWNMDFYYKPEPDGQGHPYSLISAGPDRQFGTADDVSLWAVEQPQQ